MKNTDNVRRYLSTSIIKHNIKIKQVPNNMCKIKTLNIMIYPTIFILLVIYKNTPPYNLIKAWYKIIEIESYMSHKYETIMCQSLPWLILMPLFTNISKAIKQKHIITEYITFCTKTCNLLMFVSFVLGA